MCVLGIKFAGAKAIATHTEQHTQTAAPQHDAHLVALLIRIRFSRVLSRLCLFLPRPVSLFSAFLANVVSVVWAKKRRK